MPKLLLPLLAALGAVAAAAPSAAAQERASFAPGEVIVRYATSADAAERREIRDERRLDVEETLSLPRTQVLDLPPGASVRATVASLEREPGVVYAEPNYVFEPKAEPNDPGWPQPGLWGLRRIQAPLAWDRVTGSPGVTVAVIDSGVDPTHTDLAPRLWTNAAEDVDGVDDDGNGHVDDVRGWDFVGDDNDPRDADGHGSHVAGTIAARGNDGSGVPGVNWDARLMSLRVCGAGCLLGDVADAIVYAAAKGVRVANLSLGGPNSSTTLTNAIGAAPNLLVVAAAGNEGVNNDAGATPSYPCNVPLSNVVCVAASDQNDGPASFTNWGAQSVDLAAPGVGILSTFPFSDLYRHTFAGGSTTGWELSGGWAVENDPGGDPVLSDSPRVNYANNAEATATRTAVSTGGAAVCSATYDIDRILAAGDVLHVEVQRNGGAWQEIASLTGDVEWSPEWHELPMAAGQTQLALRFRLTTNAAGVARGVWLDNVTLTCRSSGDLWAELDGTSMASPHVAGAAALLLARRPAATTAQLREALLQTGDTLPAAWAAGRPIATNRRLNAFSAVQRIEELVPGGATTTSATTQTGSPQGDTGQQQPPADPAAPTAQQPLPLPLPQPSPRADTPAGAATALTRTLRNRGLGLLLRATVRRPYRSARAGALRFRILAGRTTVAQGSARYSAAGLRTVSLRTTRAGRSLVRARRRLALTVRVTFTPSTGRAVSAARRVTATRARR